MTPLPHTTARQCQQAATEIAAILNRLDTTLAARGERVAGLTLVDGRPYVALTVNVAYAPCAGSEGGRGGSGGCWLSQMRRGVQRAAGGAR